MVTIKISKDEFKALIDCAGYAAQSGDFEYDGRIFKEALAFIARAREAFQHED